MSYTTYTAVVTFVDNNPTGLDHNFFNGLENFCKVGWFDSAFTSDGSGNLTATSYISTFNKVNPSGTVLNGGTNGTATLYQPQRGTWKVVLILLNAFRTAAAAQTIALPVAFTTQAFVQSGNVGSATNFNGFALLSSGTPQSIQVVTALASGGGTSSSVTTMFGNSYGAIFAAFDTIQFKASSSGNASGIIKIEGI